MAETTKKEIPSREQLIAALKRLDDWASNATEDNDNGEAEEQERDFDMLYDFIKNVKVK